MSGGGKILTFCLISAGQTSAKRFWFSNIDVPFATSTFPIGINDRGEIVGNYLDRAQIVHGFLYSQGVFNNIDLVGASNTLPARIKNGGQIVGSYTDFKGEPHGIVGH